MKKILQNTFRFIVMLFILNVGKANAITYTFIGPGTSWSVPSNWLGMSVPPFGFIDIGDVLNINSPCVFTPTLAIDAVNNQGVMNINSSFETGATFIPNFWGTSFLTDGTINISATGSIQNSDIILSGIINNSGVFTASASNVFLFGGTFNNLSGGIMNNEASTSMDNLCIFNNSGTFNNSNTFNVLANTSFQNSGVINNNSLIENNGNFQNLNLGVINNNPNSTLIQSGGQFNNAVGGTIVVNDYSTLTNNSGLSNFGTLSVFGWVNGAAPISNFGGTITGHNPYLIKGFNQPIVMVGSGVLTPSGIYGKITIENPTTVQNFANTTINLSIFNSGTYTSIELSGNANLNGATINVTLDPAYVPANGDVFTFIDATGFPIASPTLNLPVIPGFTWSTTYLSGNLVSTLNASIVLPITLKQLTVKELSFGNQLNWEVENHTNFSHFEIEKSYNAKQFDKIGSVTISQENNYQFQDLNVKEGVTYYRLKLVDIDGAYTFSNIVSVNSTISNDLIVVNNPVKEGAALQVISKSAFKVYALNGSEIKNLSSLSSGIYIITNADGQSTKFVVE